MHKLQHISFAFEGWTCGSGVKLFLIPVFANITLSSAYSPRDATFATAATPVVGRGERSGHWHTVSESQDV